MPRRIFIAINLPENVKKELSSFKEKWEELPARWVKPENLHITLAFLGYVKDEDLPKIIEITKKVASHHQKFSINLIKICYAPPKIKPPRMVWALGEKSKELANLQNDLRNSLLNLKIPQIEEETRSFTPHITLARIRKFEFRKIDPEDRPEIDEDIFLSLKVNSIEVMESHLKRKGAEYTILESCQLKD